MDWKQLVQNAQQYGFLGPIVGIAGLLIGAGTAILFGFTGAFDKWKPPEDVLPEPLSRVVTMLCAVAIFLAWILAEPKILPVYVRSVVWLAGVGVLSFLGYVGLYVYCGRFRRPLVENNQPAGQEVIWGGFWLTPAAKNAVRNGATVEQFLEGNGFHKDTVWSGPSLAVAAVATALVLLATLFCGAAAISTAATSAQVALTKKPAREIFGTKDVPGLPAGEKPTPDAKPK